MKLGEGRYGEVFLVQDGRECVAVKKMSLRSDEARVPAFREVLLLSALRHPNIVSFLRVTMSPTHCSLYLEYLPTCLRRLLVGPLERDRASSLYRDLLSGLSHCHQNRVMHRDIKPENLLVSCDMRLKLADFGLARPAIAQTASGERARPHTPQMVTLWYRPIETLRGGDYCLKADVWSAGCVFYEMLTGAVLFEEETEPGMVRLVDKIVTHDPVRFSPLRHVGDDALQFLQDHFERPERRLAAAEALRHPFWQSDAEVARGGAGRKKRKCLA